jgi:Polyketide cyclase / dehydrase and lipid transport
MSSSFVIENSIQINASAITVEECLTDLELMHQWLNPALRCQPVGVWETTIGAESRFLLQIPFWQPSLTSVVVAREPGLIVWEFTGFFQGCDRWECQPMEQETTLLNKFQFTIPNPLVSWGFQTFAASWTQKDMQAQLHRIKSLAERRNLVG